LRPRVTFLWAPPASEGGHGHLVPMSGARGYPWAGPPVRVNLPQKAKSPRRVGGMLPWSDVAVPRAVADDRRPRLEEGVGAVTNP
jgi:hypothetical protein